MRSSRPAPATTIPPRGWHARRSPATRASPTPRSKEKSHRSSARWASSGARRANRRVIVVLLPAGVEVCLDSTDALCSANADPAKVSAQFCSYHSQVTTGRAPAGLRRPAVDRLHELRRARHAAAAAETRRRRSSRRTPGSAWSARSARLRWQRSSTRSSTAGSAHTTDPRSTTTNGCQPVGTGLDTFSFGRPATLLPPARVEQRRGDRRSIPYTYFGCAPDRRASVRRSSCRARSTSGDTVDVRRLRDRLDAARPERQLRLELRRRHRRAPARASTHTYAKGGNYTVTLTRHRPRRQPGRRSTRRSRCSAATACPCRRPTRRSHGPTNTGSSGALSGAHAAAAAGAALGAALRDQASR